MVRITIKDIEQTISFLSSEAMMLRLVAGCSINPANVGELLIATEAYQRNITTAVMADLMEFDKALRRQGLPFIHQAVATARAKGDVLNMTFQVVDEVTQQEALQPRCCELIVFDLVKRIIQTSDGLVVPVSGVVHVHTGDQLTDQTITYILPQDWRIQPL